MAHTLSLSKYLNQANTMTQFTRLIMLFRNPFFFGAYLLLISISFLFLDKPIALFFHTHSNLFGLHTFFEWITLFGKGTYYLIGFLGAFLFFRFVYKNERLANTFLFLWIAILMAALACDVLKIILARARPVEFFTHGIYGFQFFKWQYAFGSFPSGHATVIAAIMMGLGCFKPRYCWLFLLMILLIASSRVFLTAHYLSDVLAGFYLSTLCVSILFNKWPSVRLPQYVIDSSNLGINDPKGR